MFFIVTKRPFGSPISKWKGNGRLYVKVKWAQRNQTGPKYVSADVELAYQKALNEPQVSCAG